MNENSVLTDEEKGIDLELLDAAKGYIDEMIFENLKYADHVIDNSRFLVDTAKELV